MNWGWVQVELGCNSAVWSSSPPYSGAEAPAKGILQRKRVVLVLRKVVVCGVAPIWTCNCQDRHYSDSWDTILIAMLAGSARKDNYEQIEKVAAAASVVPVDNKIRELFVTLCKASLTCRRRREKTPSCRICVHVRGGAVHRKTPYLSFNRGSIDRWWMVVDYVVTGDGRWMDG